jgi:hypothetical protein
MSQDKKLRTFDDLLRVVRALGYEFKTDTVFIVGSQAILASMPDAPEAARESPEIDAFPQNAKIWEVEEAQRTRDGVRPIASEHIDGLFGSESQFHRTHGFYIDGVDETTAKLPKGWQGRAVKVRTEVEGRTVTAVAPAAEDLVVSEVARRCANQCLIRVIQARRPPRSRLRFLERARRVRCEPGEDRPIACLYN